MSRRFVVTGMSCDACRARVEKAVSGLDGIDACNVNLLTNSLTVEGKASDTQIIEAVENAGYGAHVSEDASDGILEDKESPILIKRLIISAILLVFLMYLSMGHMMAGFPLPKFMESPIVIGTAEGVIALAVMFVNKKFFTSGFKSLFSGSPNMDTLVALGSLTSFCYSHAVMFLAAKSYSAGDTAEAHNYVMNLYFESAAMIPTFITIGKLLEAKSKGRTTSALKDLIKLAPDEALVIRDGKEVTVNANEVLKGDVFVIKPGAKIPVDGVVKKGNSAVVEAALTGESIPSEKQAGDKVYAGTVNTNGYLECEAQAVGQDTALAQVIKLVTESSATKAPIARIADKVAAVFVPVVMGLALITFAGWLIAGREFSFAIARGISVLVISCPCALGLATPVAVMVGNGIGAKNGILFKTSAALEACGKCDVVVLDKTGTVTRGLPQVTDVNTNIDEHLFIDIAYSIESMSEHPIAAAIVSYCEERGANKSEAKDFESHAGGGIAAEINGQKVRAGSLKFVSLPEEFEAQAQLFAAEGKTPVAFECDGNFIGMLALRDEIRPESVEAIKNLKPMGLGTVMLTGDNKKVADAIASRAQVTRVISEVLPADKDKVIRTLESQNLKVVMVGDGINDAPALTSADIGMAIGSGTDVAIDAADVVLVKNNLGDVPAAIRLSRLTLRNVKENLFWAFIYNAICIPLAAGVYGFSMKPMYAALAMAASSVCVCMNALRLNFANIRKYGKERDSSSVENIILNTEFNLKGGTNLMKTMKISGMMCEHCQKRVKKALEAIDGVKSADVSFEKGTAIVDCDGVDDAVLAKAVTDEDYEVISIE